MSRRSFASPASSRAAFPADRDDPEPGVFRIALIGDPQMEGYNRESREGFYGACASGNGSDGDGSGGRRRRRRVGADLAPPGWFNNVLNDQMMRIITKSVVRHAAPNMLVVLGDLLYHHALEDAPFDYIARRFERAFVDHHAVGARPTPMRRSAHAHRRFRSSTSSAITTSVTAPWCVGGAAAARARRVDARAASWRRSAWSALSACLGP